MNDYFKAVNTDEYEDLLQTTSQRYKDGIVFFATSLGDLIIFSDNYVRILMYRYGKVKTIMYTFEFFFQNIFDSDFQRDRKSTRLNSSHVSISYAVFCLKKKRHNIQISYK